MTMIYPLYDFHIFLHVIPLKMAPPLPDGHKASMALRKSVYTTFVPRTTKSEELFFISFLPPRS